MRLFHPEVAILGFPLDDRIVLKEIEMNAPHVVEGPLSDVSSSVDVKLIFDHEG